MSIAVAREARCGELQRRMVRRSGEQRELQKEEVHRSDYASLRGASAPAAQEEVRRSVHTPRYHTPRYCSSPVSRRQVPRQVVRRQVPRQVGGGVHDSRVRRGAWAGYNVVIQGVRRPHQHRVELVLRGAEMGLVRVIDTSEVLPPLFCARMQQRLVRGIFTFF